MYIQSMTIANVPPFTNIVSFRFDDRVNLFIGPNGCGKTTAVKQIEPAYQHSTRELTYECVPYTWSEQVSVQASAEYSGNEAAPLTFLSMPAVRIPLPQSHSIVPDYTLVNDFVTIEGVYDTRFTFRQIQDIHDDISGIINHNLTAVFLNEYSGSSQEGLLRWWGDDGTPQQAIGRRVDAIVDIVVRCTTYICQEIMTGGFPSSHAHSVEHGLQRARGIDQVTYDLWGVPVIDDQTGAVTIGELSSGTQGALMWIWGLAIALNERFMKWSYGDITARYALNEDDEEAEVLTGSPAVKPEGTTQLHVSIESKLVTGGEVEYHYEWRKMPFVLVIDEIENHLHPTWQRRLIPALLEHFPNMQLFATTHSPFVVAGLKAGQVHLLDRDENGIVTATTNTEDIVGWTADEILRTMMGVRDPTDDETARNAAELRQLRDEGKRAEKHAEDERQNRMQQLRRLLDRDLLAGGPKARRREEFSQRFRAAMERLQKEDQISQDNG